MWLSFFSPETVINGVCIGWEHWSQCRVHKAVNLPFISTICPVKDCYSEQRLYWVLLCSVNPLTIDFSSSTLFSQILVVRFLQSCISRNQCFAWASSLIERNKYCIRKDNFVPAATSTHDLSSLTVIFLPSFIVFFNVFHIFCILLYLSTYIEFVST